MIVQLRPVEVKRWHGKSPKDSNMQSIRLRPLVNERTGRYETGLSEEETKTYSEKLGLDLSNIYVPGKAHDVWDTNKLTLSLGSTPVILDTDNPRDYIRYKFALASPFVAASFEEWESGMASSATHIIFSEEEELAQKAKKVDIENEARMLAFKMSGDQKSNIIRILANKSVASNSNDFLNVEIDELIKKNPLDFINHAKMDNKDMVIRGQVLECLFRSILTKEGSSVYYMGELIAPSTDETIAWFKDSSNQKLKLAILAKLNS